MFVFIEFNGGSAKAVAMTLVVLLVLFFLPCFFVPLFSLPAGLMPVTSSSSSCCFVRATVIRFSSVRVCSSCRLFHLLASVAKKRYQAVGSPYNRMLKLSSSRGIRIDVPVLSVSWSFVDHSVIIQALISSTRPAILEESLVGSPLVQIVWQRLQ